MKLIENIKTYRLEITKDEKLSLSHECGFIPLEVINHNPHLKSLINMLDYHKDDIK